MKVLLILPAAERYRVTGAASRVPKRNMLRFSVLGLTTVAALTPPGHEVAICDENVEPLDLDADVDVVGVTFMTGLAPRDFIFVDDNIINDAKYAKELFGAMAPMKKGWISQCSIEIADRLPAGLWSIAWLWRRLRAG